MTKPLETLVLYDAQSTFTNTVYDHVDAFARHSGHRITYACILPASRKRVSFDAFDAVVVHYSVRVALGWLPDRYRDALARYSGLKILFLQDEYEYTETARRAIEDLGIGVLFTCVPDAYREAIYPRARFPRLRLEPTLTGYVLDENTSCRTVPRISERKLVIGYRGRSLPFWYGDLGQEKVRIGQRMREICRARGIPVDIAWEEADRIYGERWVDFLASCKSTLGTESGSNVFDERGEVRRAVEAELAARPDVTYEEVAEKHLKHLEGRVRMNQVSPRVFEAATLRTALVLFDGEYSDVVRPDRHFIPLRKDFSNVDQVLARLADDDELQSMVDLTYSEIIASGRYGYRQFIDRFDAVVRDCIGSLSRARASSVNGAQDSAFTSVLARHRAAVPGTSSRPLRARQSWLHPVMNAVWTRTPQSVKPLVRPLARRLYWALMRVERS
jgi:hypothetical protein